MLLGNSRNSLFPSGPDSADGGKNRARQGTPDAIVSVSRIMQAVPGNQSPCGNTSIDRTAHQRKARKKTNPLFVGDFADDVLDGRVLRRGENDRSILQIHEDNIRSGSPDHADASRYFFLDTIGSSAPGNI